MTTRLLLLLFAVAAGIGQPFQTSRRVVGVALLIAGLVLVQRR
jgi:hypothetical protein